MNKLIEFMRRYSSDSTFRTLVQNSPEQAFSQSNLDDKTREQITEYLQNPDTYRGKSATRPQTAGWW